MNLLCSDHVSNAILFRDRAPLLTITRRTFSAALSFAVQVAAKLRILRIGTRAWNQIGGFRSELQPVPVRALRQHSQEEQRRSLSPCHWLPRPSFAGLKAK